MNIKDKLIEICENIGIDALTANLKESIDSLQFIRFIVLIEESFNIELPDDTLVLDIFKLDDFVQIIENLTSN